MFESLQDNLSQAFKAIRGQARLSESNMRDGLELVRKALLEADVSFPVVKDFMQRVSDQAVGERVLKSVRPHEMVVGIVHQELINLMGPGDTSLHLRDFTKIMLCGLQGSGKTTTCAKLARLLKQHGRKPMLVAADLQRPAAIHQLQVLGEQIGVPVCADTEATDPIAHCRRGVKQAQESGADVVIFDTAGRLHIDDELMRQLQKIDERVEPHEVYLVVDGMTGQDAVNSADAFNKALNLNGAILTKLDGDARGGAVLSVRAVTGVPIKFIGTGEHLQDLEAFRPEGMAERILGMGDIVGLIQKAQTEFDEDELRKQQEDLAKGEFTLDTFRNMLKQTSRLGPLNKLMGMIPGMSAMKDAMGDIDADEDFKRINGIIDSMTAEERRNPKKTIDQSRRRRIAAGAGVEAHEVNDLVKQFEPMADMMKKMGGMGVRDRMKAMQELQSDMMQNPGGQLSRQKKGTGKRLSNKERAKLKKDRDRELRRRKRESRSST